MTLFRLIKVKINNIIFIITCSFLFLFITISIQDSIQINNYDKFVIILKDLPPKSVGEVVEKLKENRITFEIRDEGRSIAVQEKQKEEALTTIAKFGLPHYGRVGVEIFGDKAFGVLTNEPELEKK